MTTEREISQKPANVLMPWYIGVMITLVFVILTWQSVGGLYEILSDYGFVETRMAAFVVIGVIGTIWSLARFTTVQPYERLVISQFGRYVGVESREGLSWLTPLYSSQTISTALRNFETDTVKVNDRGGSPIDIAVVVVTRVVDPAKAVYLVENVKNFVEQQVVASLRTVAASHDYDGEDSKAAEEARTETVPGESPVPVTKSRYTLRGDLDEIAEELKAKAQEGLGDIGVQIVEIRITHLAYSPEIAAAMLNRQQAQAVVAARETIVKGAVSIIEDTMQLLEQKEMKLDEDRRATLTRNMLVVLSSDREAAPVMPVGA